VGAYDGGAHSDPAIEQLLASTTSVEVMANDRTENSPTGALTATVQNQKTTLISTVLFEGAREHAVSVALKSSRFVGDASRVNVWDSGGPADQKRVGSTSEINVTVVLADDASTGEREATAMSLSPGRDTTDTESFTVTIGSGNAPASPTDLAAAVDDRSGQLSWRAGRNSSLAGHNLYISTAQSPIQRLCRAPTEKHSGLGVCGPFEERSFENARGLPENFGLRQVNKPVERGLAL